MAARRPRLLVIGAGMAGARLLGELGQRCPARYDITVIGAEAHGFYNRILLSPLLAGERQVEELALAEVQAMPAATLRLGDPVTALDCTAQVATTRSGARLPYDYAVLTVGSEPIRPPLPGMALPGVFTFRQREDAEALIGASHRARRAVVVGGGLLGLEAAYGLARRGLQVTVVHLADWLMERQLDSAAAKMLRASLMARGIAVLTQATTAAIVGDTHATGLRLADGNVLPADIVVFAIGVRPNTALARAAGLATGRGILVDDRMTTSDPTVLAIGECVQHRGATFGLVAPIWEQAAVAAAQLAGEADSRYGGSPPATSLKITGVELFSAGHIAADADGEEIVFEDSEAGIYRKLVIKDGRLVGAVLLGDARDGMWYAELMRGAAEIGAFRQELVFGRDFVAAPAAPP